MGFMERFAPSVFLSVAAGGFAWIMGKGLEAVRILPANSAEVLYIILSAAVVGRGLVSDIKQK